MIIPSSSFGVIASSRPRAVAAGPDVTPNPVNWSDDVNYYTASTNTQTISGIGTTINLSISHYTNAQAGAGYAPTYSKNGANFVAFNTNPFTISVSDGDTLRFAQETNLYIDRTFTVRNASDGDAVLDTFTLVASTD